MVLRRVLHRGLQARGDLGVVVLAKDLELTIDPVLLQNKESSIDLDLRNFDVVRRCKILAMRGRLPRGLDSGHVPVVVVVAEERGWVLIPIACLIASMPMATTNSAAKNS